MKRILLTIVLLFSFAFIVGNVDAAAKKAAGPSIATSAKFNKPKNTVNAYFGNMRGVKSVTYVLMYQGNGIGQGVEGSFSPGKKTAISKNFFLGTCSGKACIKHKNIKNIQLEVFAKFTNGKTSKKIYKIK